MANIWRIEAELGNFDLCAIIKTVAPLQVAAARQLLTQEPSDHDLCTILERVPQLRAEVADLILGMEKPSHMCLRYIIAMAGTKELEAGRRLLLDQPTFEDLFWIHKVPELVAEPQHVTPSDHPEKTFTPEALAKHRV